MTEILVMCSYWNHLSRDFVTIERKFEFLSNSLHILTTTTTTTFIHNIQEAKKRKETSMENKIIEDDRLLYIQF